MDEKTQKNKEKTLEYSFALVFIKIFPAEWKDKEHWMRMFMGEED